MIKFTIPYRLPSLNDYVLACRGNKYGGNKTKQQIEDGILWILTAIKQRIDKPVYVYFVWHEKTRRRDKDNVAFAKKFILDALQKSHILPNDNNKFVLGFRDSFVYGGEGKVEVVICEEKEICEE